MRTAIDIRRKAQGDVNGFLEIAGDFIKARKLCLGLDIDLVNAFIGGKAQLSIRFADAGENNLVGWNAGGKEQRISSPPETISMPVPSPRPDNSK